MIVSVAMPAFNRAHVIREALESALAQTFTDFEIIVVDDGSRDNTSEIVAQFRDPRIRCIRLEQNKGVAAARNLIRREARGELISFLDSDDLWKPSKLQKEVDFLKRHPEADAVFEDLEKYDRGVYIASFQRQTPYFSTMLAERNYPHEIVFTEREMYLCLLREVPIKPTALTVRVGTLQRAGWFNEDWRAGSDWEYLIRLSRVCRFGYLDERLAVLRLQDDATHRLYRVESLAMQLALYKQELLQLKEDMEATDAVNWSYCAISKHLASTYLASGKQSEAARAYARAFRETGNTGMLARALFAYLPPGVRDSFKKLRGKTKTETIAQPITPSPDSVKPS